jgi:hypothetical protein
VTILGVIATTVLTHAATSSAASGSTLTQPLFGLILTILARRRLAAKLRAEISRRKLDERAAGVCVGR